MFWCEPHFVTIHTKLEVGRCSE